MIIHHIETCDIPVNPLDLMEEIVSSNEWPFDRPSDRELRVEFSGQWCDYRLYFGWAKEISAMQFSCAYDMKVPEPKTSEVCTLLSIINERLWVGHFDLASESRLLSFRHGVLLRGMHGFVGNLPADMITRNICATSYESVSSGPVLKNISLQMMHYLIPARYFPHRRWPGVSRTANVSPGPENIK